MPNESGDSSNILNGSSNSKIAKPAAVDFPSISKPLIEVFRVGGIPLALLFIITTIIGYLLTARFATEALSTVLLILKWMLAGSFGSFAVLTTLGYLKWREEIKVRLEEHRLNMEEYRERYRTETALQEKFVSLISQHGAAIAAAHPDWAASDIKSGIDALAKSVEGILPRMMELRVNMRQLPITAPALTVNAQPRAAEP
jgi:hypothetical protein